MREGRSETATHPWPRSQGSGRPWRWYCGVSCVPLAGGSLGEATRGYLPVEGADLETLVVHVEDQVLALMGEA